MDAAPEVLFAALTTLDGLGAWWTPTVTGRPSEGGEVTFAFGDETVTMHVDRAEPFRLVRWTCLAHTRFPEWRGTSLQFDIGPAAGGRSVLAFRHTGLVPDLECYGVCSQGWTHYVTSLATHVGGDGGRPWGSAMWRPARP